MNKTNLREAIAEAERFLERACVLIKEADQYEYQNIQASIKSGACRRASLDLTRALARMRKSGDQDE